MEHVIFLIQHHGDDVQTLNRFFEKKKIPNSIYKYPDKMPACPSQSFNVVIFFDKDYRDKDNYIETLDATLRQLIDSFDNGQNRNYFISLNFGEPLNFELSEHNRLRKPTIIDRILYLETNVERLNDALYGGLRGAIFNDSFTRGLCFMTYIVMNLFDRVRNNFNGMDLDDLDEALHRFVTNNLRATIADRDSLIRKMDWFFAHYEEKGIVSRTYYDDEDAVAVP